MNAFRIYLIAIGLVLAGYTGVVIATHGANLLPIFFGDIAALGWPGQFNLDFSFMLSLSALWVAWRHRFTAVGLGLATLAFSFGSLFLAIYMSLELKRANGDIARMLLGGQTIH